MHLHKTFLLALALFGFGLNLGAQDFTSAVGLRFGYPLSVSYKTFINSTSALEGYVGFRGYGSFNWVSLNGAYQIHNDISEVEGLQWYYGGGAGIQFWNYDFEDNGSITVSVSGYLGAQYTFPDTPVTFSVDWVPTIFLGENFGGVNTFGGGYGALAARYVLGR
jgi:hypothetical protein